MSHVAKEGRTILFVSHNMGAIVRLCSRAFWMDAGEITMDGPSGTVVNEYQAKHLTPSANWTRSPQASVEGDVSFLEVIVTCKNGTPCVSFTGKEEVTIKVRYRVLKSLRACQIGARICSHDGTPIFTTSDSDGTGYSALPKEPGVFSTSFHLTAGLLAPGSYFVLVAAHVPQRHVYEVIEQAVAFEVANVASLASLDGRLGVVTPLFVWETTREARIGDQTSTYLASRPLV